VNLGDKMNECQNNYFEYILRLSTSKIPGTVFDYPPKRRRRERGRLRKRWKVQFA
jgi:hypothetical protein